MKIKITVLKQTIYNDLIEKYENPIKDACNIKIGDTFIINNLEKPNGLCPSAWEGMLPYLKDLFNGKGYFFDNWMKNPYSVMYSCNDGFRPVTFLIELLK